MVLKKIHNKNISDIVFDQLKANILSEEWKPGDKLPSELVLTEQLGVSRITVRSALQRLLSLGLVVTRQGGGTFVRERENAEALTSLLPILAAVKPDVKYFLEFRMVVEPNMASLAALRATDDQLDQMEAYVDGFENTDAGDWAQALDYDLGFHCMIAQASQNPILIKTYEVFRDIYRSNLEQIVQQYGTSSGTRYHREILAAIRHRDPDLAHDHMQAHLETTSAMLKDKLKTQKEA